MVGVRRIDPDIVEVAMRAARDVAETLSAIIAGNERQIRLVDLVGILRIDNEIRKVERTPNHVLTAIARLPCLAAIIRTIEAVLRRFRLNERIDEVGIR